jgi:transcriptional regulator
MAIQKSDLPQGTLDLLILKVVAAGPRHGYAIAQRLQLISQDVVQVQQGTLYPALHRLENKGLLSSEWKISDTGREAKFYRLTRKGRAAMEHETASWQRLAAAVGLILDAAEGEASGPGGGVCCVEAGSTASWTLSCAIISTASRPTTSRPGWRRTRRATAPGWHSAGSIR